MDSVRVENNNAKLESARSSPMKTITSSLNFRLPNENSPSRKPDFNNSAAAKSPNGENSGKRIVYNRVSKYRWPILEIIFIWLSQWSQIMIWNSGRFATVPKYSRSCFKARNTARTCQSEKNNVSIGLRLVRLIIKFAFHLHWTYLQLSNISF